MSQVEVFVGPVTVYTITKWLSDCEITFRAIDSSNQQRLTDKEKIDRAGAAISKDSKETSRLSTWWQKRQSSLERNSWDRFKKSFKTYALGPDWERDVLNDLYQLQQDDTSADEYIARLEDIRFAVERSSLNKISDFEFKCHMLFRARPKIAIQVIQQREFEFSKTSIDEIAEGIRSYETDESTEIPDPIPS
jgi:hypothetical protein